MKVTIEIDSYLAGRLREAIYDTDGHYAAFEELQRLIETAQREAIVAKASGNLPLPNHIVRSQPGEPHGQA